MGNRRTENGKRSIHAFSAAWGCRDCWPVAADDLQGRPEFAGFCERHGCGTITKAGTRCKNSATYPDEQSCGIHLTPRDAV